MLSAVVTIELPSSTIYLKYFRLTYEVIFYILLSGMHIKLNILNSFSRKACYIIFTLFISISFSVGGALSIGCEGGPDCLNCARPAHLHVQGAKADMGNHGCWPGDNNATCGVEDNQNPDRSGFITVTARSESHNFSGFFNAASDENVLSHLLIEYPSPFPSPRGNGIIPIYLLNHSLLC